MQQTWSAPLGQLNGAAATAFASFTLYQDINPGLTGAAPLSAGQLTAGSVLRLTAYGVVSDTATPTLILGFYYGGSPLAVTAATALGSGVVNVPWRLEWTGRVLTVGATGTIIGAGFGFVGTSVSAIGMVPLPATALAAVTIDTTTAKALTVGATFSANNAANTITCHGFHAESVA